MIISNGKRIVSIQTQNGAEFIEESCNGFTGLPEVRAIFIQKINSQVLVDYELPLSPALEAAQAPIEAPTEVQVKQQQQQNTPKVAKKIERRSLKNRNRNKRRRTGSFVAENSLPPSAPTSEQDDQIPAPQPIHISQPVTRVQQSESSDEGEDGINPNMIIPAEQLIQDYANEAKESTMDYAAPQDMEVELPVTEAKEETSESDDSGTESDTEASSDEEEEEEESPKVETTPAEPISNTAETPKEQEKPDNADITAMAVDTPQQDVESCKNSLNHSESASDFTESSSEGSESDTEYGSESESDEEQTLLEGNVPPAVKDEGAPVVKRESDVDSDSSSSSGSEGSSSSSEEEGDSKSKMEHLLMDSAKQKKDMSQSFPNKQMFEDQDVLNQKKGFIKGITKSNKIRAVKPPPKKLKKPEALLNNNGNTVSMNIDQEASELLKNPNAINELIGNDAQWE